MSSHLGTAGDVGGGLPENVRGAEGGGAAGHNDHDDRTVTIQFDNVGKSFGDRWIVRDLDVEVRGGTILGLVGPSGCGKSTAVGLAIGINRPDEGRVTVLGEDPVDRPTGKRTAIGYLPQSPVLFADLSLRGNLNFHASLNGVRWRRRRRLRELFELVSLTGEERKLVRNASGGMQRRLALAATLVHDPPILVLDEPTAGIDPLLRRQIWDHFRSLRDAGRTIVVTTQHVNEAAHCDVVIVLDEGRVLATGTPDELSRLAFGGDVASISLGEPSSTRILQQLRDTEGVIDVQSIEARQLRVIVDDAKTTITRIAERLAAAGVAVDDISQVATDWDELFIELLNSENAATPVAADAEARR